MSTASTAGRLPGRSVPAKPLVEARRPRSSGDRVASAQAGRSPPRTGPGSSSSGGPMLKVGSGSGRPSSSLLAQLLRGVGVDWPCSSHTTPYRRAPSTVTSPRRTSSPTSSGSRASGSPHPPPPQVTKCSRSPTFDREVVDLAGQHLGGAVRTLEPLPAPRARLAAVDAPRVGEPAVVVDGDGARLEEAVGDVDAVAAPVQRPHRPCPRRSPTARCAAGSTTRGTRTGCSRRTATASARPGRHRSAGRGCRRSRSSRAGTTRPCGRPVL